MNFCKAYHGTNRKTSPRCRANALLVALQYRCYSTIPAFQIMGWRFVAVDLNPIFFFFKKKIGIKIEPIWSASFTYPPSYD